MVRGGRRSGTPGKNYANRSDLNQTRQLPVTAAPGQEYGQAGAQADAQRAVPMGSGDLSGTSPQPATDHADVMAQAAAYDPPAVTPLTAPTQRPGEHPLTPPTTGPSTQGALLSSVALLNSLGTDASPAVKALRDVLNAGQANAATP